MDKVDLGKPSKTVEIGGEQIAKLAQEAGFNVHNGVIRVIHSNGSWVSLNDRLEVFAEVLSKVEHEMLSDILNSGSFLAPVGHSAWGEAYQDGWSDAISKVREFLEKR